ncbi:MAG TPA: hypothetical protein VG734_17210 [Lacunisphaera sp.]|nr:hypothetical protein [Lacunisphaera sp.]
MVTKSAPSSASKAAVLTLQTVDINGDGQADSLPKKMVTGERHVWLMNGIS